MSCKKTSGVERLIKSKERKKEKIEKRDEIERKNVKFEKVVAGEQQSSFPFGSQMKFADSQIETRSF